MKSTPSMLWLYVSHPRTGDGYRAVFVLSDKGETATIYVLGQLAAITLPKASLEKAQAKPYRPHVVREQILKRARCCRKHGRRFPRAATVQLLHMLGAAGTVIEAAVRTPALPATLAAQAQRAVDAERRAQLAEVATAIRDKIEFQLANPPPALPMPCRTPGRYPHPDQLALAL